MEQEMLSKVRTLNWVLSKDLSGITPFSNLCIALSDLTKANVYILDKYGKALGGYCEFIMDQSTDLHSKISPKTYPVEKRGKMPKNMVAKFDLSGKEIKDVYKYNIKTENIYRITIPIIIGKETFGSLIMTRHSPDFNCEDLVLGEFGATIIGLEIQRSAKRKNEVESRKDETLKVAMGTLSYTENEAIKKIFEELNGMEGIINASKIADHSRIARSVTVTALRKLECAGIIVSKSLGMKGTHIRVLNENLLGLLNSLKI